MSSGSGGITQTEIAESLISFSGVDRVQFSWQQWLLARLVLPPPCRELAELVRAVQALTSQYARLFVWGSLILLRRKRKSMCQLREVAHLAGVP